MDARVAFTSVGVNRAAGALDWDLVGRAADAEQSLAPPSLIAYGGASAVCLFDAEVGTCDGERVRLLLNTGRELRARRRGA